MSIGEASTTSNVLVGSPLPHGFANNQAHVSDDTKRSAECGVLEGKQGDDFDHGNSNPSKGVLGNGQNNADACCNDGNGLSVKNDDDVDGDIDIGAPSGDEGLHVLAQEAVGRSAASPFEVPEQMLPPPHESPYRRGDLAWTAMRTSSYMHVR